MIANGRSFITTLTSSPSTKRVNSVRSLSCASSSVISDVLILSIQLGCKLDHARSNVAPQGLLDLPRSTTGGSVWTSRPPLRAGGVAIRRRALGQTSTRAMSAGLAVLRRGPGGRSTPGSSVPGGRRRDRLVPFFAFSAPIRRGDLHDQRDREPERHGAACDPDARELPERPCGIEADLPRAARGREQVNRPARCPRSVPCRPS